MKISIIEDTGAGPEVKAMFRAYAGAFAEWTAKAGFRGLLNAHTGQWVKETPRPDGTVLMQVETTEELLNLFEQEQ